MSLIEDSLPYITGMGYRKIADFKYDEFNKDNIVNNQFDNMLIFVKTDLLHEFHNKILTKINRKFYLISHNSDMAINKSYFNILNNGFLIKWFAQNVMIEHDKLFSIPIGFANNRWSHGNKKIIDKVVNSEIEKNNLIYCNLSTETNALERHKCLKSILPIQNSKKVDFETYLNNVGGSYFQICPNGNGVDTHKLWESLYMKTIPIVTKTVNSYFYKDLPIFFIDKWEDFNYNLFNETLYYNIWGDFKIEDLNLTNMLKKMYGYEKKV